MTEETFDDFRQTNCESEVHILTWVKDENVFPRVQSFYYSPNSSQATHHWTQMECTPHSLTQDSHNEHVGLCTLDMWVVNNCRVQ